MFGQRQRDRRPQAAAHQTDAHIAGAAGRDTAEATTRVGPGARGPFDGQAAPDDGHARIDLGSLLLPAPRGAQLQLEVDRAGPVREVHLMTAHGQLSVSAFAAPKSSGLWDEVASELVEQLRSEGARVEQVEGEWGRELVAVTSEAALRFVGVDGPRWVLRGMAAASEPAPALVEQLRDVVRHTVVVRGSGPLPVRSPLPLRPPEPLAEQLDRGESEA